MMLSNEIVKFADGNTDFYVGFAEYYNKAEKTMEDHTSINNAFFAEVERVSGVAREGLNAGVWATAPQVQWAALSVVDASANVILPQVITPAFGMFMDMRFVDRGDIMKFKIRPNQFYTVSLGGHGERTTHRQKSYSADIPLAPREHMVTVFTDWYSVLAGKEDIGDFLTRVVLSIEKEMYKDALGALMAGLEKIPSGDYNVEGAYNPKELVKMCQTVTAYNAGVKPVIAGSTVALMNVLPDSASGYRLNVDGVDGGITVMKDFYTYSVVALEQAAAGNDKLVLPDNKLFVVSPTQDKLVKGAVSSAMDNVNQHFDNSDLTSNFTMRKDWDFVFASSAKAGIYTING